VARLLAFAMTQPESVARDSRRLWLGYGAMCVGMCMAILDIQVVASSLTNIAAALDLSDSHLGWIQTSYPMAEVIAIPLTALLTRAFSLRWMFAAATLAFTLASIGCALSASIGMLMAFRVAQGFFGGMLIPAVFTAVFIMPHLYRALLALRKALIGASPIDTAGDASHLPQTRTAPKVEDPAFDGILSS